MKTQLKGVTGQELAKSQRRRNFLIWLCLALVIVVGATGYIAFKPWRLRTLHRESREALEKGDFSGASLNARRALQLDPNFAPACVTMAEIAEHDRLSDAVAWREQVIKLTGESADTLLSLASTALRFGKISSAHAALERVPEKDRQREDYLVLAGTIALEAGLTEDAARFYENATRIQPENPAYRLALGKAQCASGDYLVRESGRHILTELTPHETFGVPALRTLIASSEAQEEYQSALRLAHQLVALPAHEFSDEILRLRLMKMTGDDKLAGTLATTQQRAETNPNHAGTLLLWMSRFGLANEGLEWVQKRSPKLGISPELKPAIAGCYLTKGDWNALLNITTPTGAWKPVDYIRRAYRARAFREQGENSFARTEWNLALNTATRQVEALTWLAQIASEWKWEDETEQTLWALLDLAPGSRWAIDALHNHYATKMNTPGLRRIAVHLLKTDPADENAKNNVALSSLLLNTGTDYAMTLARELHQKYPENAAYASTFAFALHCATRTTEGIKVLETLPPERLEEPSIAAYYGILLVANNSTEKARRFLELGRQAELLREESDLLAKAERMIANLLP